MRGLPAQLIKIVAGVVLSGIAALCLLLCTMWWEHTTPVSLPQPTGTLGVGRSWMTWNNPASGQELAVWMWYPAAQSDQPTSEYLPIAWQEALRAHQGTFMRSFFKRHPAVVSTHSHVNAPMPAERRRYPVVLLRPGGSALTSDFTALAEDLASHGYVVVGFDAPARSFVFVGSDGHVIGRAPGNSVENANGNLDDPVVGRLLALWVSDAKAVVDELQRLNDASSGPLQGRLDFGRLGAVGHSFGGAQALQFCHDDPRCGAAIDLDGIPFGSVVVDGLPKPAMFLLSDHSREMADPESHKVLAMIQGIYDRLPHPRIYETIRTANHFSFGDQMLLNSPIAVALLRFTGFGRLEPRRGLGIANDYVRTFFDVTLNGAPSSTLQHLSERYPEAIGLVEP
jgi:predicted dienelactone hydrolase